MGVSMPTMRSREVRAKRSRSGAPSPARKVTLALLRLTDAAPLIVAKELGVFADEGLDVQLSIEPSWANIADKIAHALIDGAVILPPLAFAISLGLRRGATPLIVPMSLALKGNTITLSDGLAADIRRGARRSGTGRARGLSIRRRCRLLADRHHTARAGWCCRRRGGAKRTAPSPIPNGRSRGSGRSGRHRARLGRIGGC
jgi:hypothetical protein